VSPVSLRARTRLPAAPSLDDEAVSLVTVFGALRALTAHMRCTGYAPTLRPSADDDGLRLRAMLRVRAALRREGLPMFPATLAGEAPVMRRASSSWGPAPGELA